MLIAISRIYVYDISDWKHLIPFFILINHVVLSPCLPVSKDTGLKLKNENNLREAMAIMLHANYLF